MVPELRELIAVQGVPALSEPEDVVHVQHAALPTPDLKNSGVTVTVSMRRF